MKNIITTTIFAPIAVSIISAGLLILSDMLLQGQMTWAIWGVILVSICCSFLIICGLCSFWLAQWLAWQVTKHPQVKKERMENLSQ